MNLFDRLFPPLQMINLPLHGKFIAANPNPASGESRRVIGGHLPI
jgi:hypothetical protein